MSHKYFIFNPLTEKHILAGDETQLESSKQALAMACYKAAVGNDNHTLIATSEDNFESTTVETYVPPEA